jgi:hypothetical protein
MPPVTPESLSQWWEQFDLTGYPNGDLGGTIPRCGVTFQLTSAQLLALQTTAVQLVAAPTASGLGNLTPPNGYAYVPTSLRAEFVPGATPYTIGNADNAFQIEYTGKTTALLNLTVTGLVDQSVATIATGATTVGTAKIAKANSSNLGLEVKLIGTTAALTLGDGTVYLTLGYTILPLF